MSNCKYTKALYIELFGKVCGGIYLVTKSSIISVKIFVFLFFGNIKIRDIIGLSTSWTSYIKWNRLVIK